jgi:hypothetical protein
VPEGSWGVSKKRSKAKTDRMNVKILSFVAFIFMIRLLQNFQKEAHNSLQMGLPHHR